MTAIASGRCGYSRMILVIFILGIGACGHTAERVNVMPRFVSQQPRCLAVVPMENLSLTSLAGVAFGEILAAELERTGQFVVLEPTAYRWVVEQMDGTVEPTEQESLRFFRRELGIEAVVVGTVTEYWYTDDPEVYRDKQPSVAVSLRMVSTDDGATLWTATASRTPSSLAARLSMLSEVAAEINHKLVDDLVEPLPLANADRLAPPCRFEQALVGSAPATARKPTRSAQPARPPESTPSPVVSSEARELAQRLQRGESFVLRGVGFEYRETQLKENADRTLQPLAELMRAYPDMVVMIIGHTDNRGEPDELRDLSLQQAEAVRQYLVGNGVNMQQVLVEGRGGDEPVLPNINRRNRMVNRRIEVQLLSPPSGGW